MSKPGTAAFRPAVCLPEQSAEPREGSEASLYADKGLSACQPAPQQAPIPCLPQPLGLPLAGPKGPCSGGLASGDFLLS